MEDQTIPNGPPEAPNGPPEAHGVKKEARMWAMIIHLSGFAIYSAIPFLNIILPLVIWQLKKDDDPFIDNQGREAVNYQICLFIYTLICIALAFFCIGIFLLFILGIANIILMVIAAIKANDGVRYEYPLIIRIL